MENTDNNIIIKVDHVSKQYRLGAIGGTTLVRELQSLGARIRGKEDPNSTIGSESKGKRGDKFMALDDISFEVKKGERIGIIGHNGAGKSTFLKLLSRVTAPTTGTISYNGRIASMLEVGTGFHPELTGRENVYMNGAILGMKKDEITRKMDDIVKFAEMETFIDTPVKRYSSGMYVKLAFSVAAHLDSEIMIMDEVLAVGDMKFQKKCLDKMSDVSKSQGRTILYVSHNMHTIRQLCDRCIVMDHGRIIFNGDVDKAIELYLENNASGKEVSRDLSIMERPGNQTGDVQMMHFNYVDKENCIYNKNEKIKFAIRWKSNGVFENVAFKIIIRHCSDSAIGVSLSNPITQVDEGKTYNTVLEFDPKMLAEGQYFVSISVFQQDLCGNDLLLDHITRAFSFEIDENEENALTWQHKYWGSVHFDRLGLVNEEL